MPTAGVVAYICNPSTWEVRPDYQGFKAILSDNKFNWGLGYFRRKKRKSTPTPTHPYTHTHTSTSVEPWSISCTALMEPNLFFEIESLWAWSLHIGLAGQGAPGAHLLYFPALGL